VGSLKAAGKEEIMLKAFLTYALIAGALTIGAVSAHAAGCDVNNDTLTNVSDVQLCVNQAIGVIACTSGDIDGNGACNVVDVQRVVNAALGGQCVTGGGSGSSRCPAFPAFPDENCTGVPQGTALTVVNGDLNITIPNTVVENKDIRGCVTVTAPGVIIRNSKITCQTGFYAVDTFQVPAPWLTIQDTTISCGNRTGTSGIGEEQITLLRVNVSGCENGFDLNRNILLQDSYIHDLAQGSVAHTDGIQMPAPGTNITIQHNRIYAFTNGVDGTSAIISNRYPTVPGTVIKENLFAGGAYSLYCLQGGPGGQHIVNNHFSRINDPTVGAFGPWTDCQDEAEVSGNVYHETGLPLPGP
jgi:hypothetical protein